MELIVRGICCLRPQVPGETDRITVISVVGRFLEHSRIYRFGRGEEEKLFISSADFMTRNTLRRVEVAAPVYDEAAKGRLRHIFDTVMRDDEKGKEQTADGSYVDRHINPEPLNSQEVFLRGGLSGGQKLTRSNGRNTIQFPLTAKRPPFFPAAEGRQEEKTEKGSEEMLKIGMLTSGGDCQALNAAMRGVVKTLCENADVKIYGFEEGYKGLIYGNYHQLTSRDFSGILTKGGHHPGLLPPALQADAGARRERPGQGGRHEEELQGPGSGLPGHPGGQRHPQDRQPAPPGGAEHCHPAQDHRQRHLGHRHDLRLPLRGGDRHQRH